MAKLIQLFPVNMYMFLFILLINHMNIFLWQFYSLNVFIGEAGREPNLDKFVKNTSLH